MKRSKYLLCGLLIVLYAGFALSTITIYESNTTWENLTNSDFFYHATDDKLDQNNNELVQNVIELNPQETNEIPGKIKLGIGLYYDLDKYDDNDDDDDDDDETDDDESEKDDENELFTKEQAENKIKEAEDKIKEVEDKLAQVQFEDGDDNDEEVETSDDENYEEAKEELEDAKEDLQNAKEAFVQGNYDGAYENAESCIEKCENALDMLEGYGGSDSGDDDEVNDPGNGDDTEDDSPDQEKIVVTVPEEFQSIETPQMVAFTAIGAIAVSNVIMLTNKRFALKFATLIVKIGDAFFAVSAVAYKIGGTLFVAIGAVLRPPSIRNIKQDEVLENDTREQIYKYICTHEGAHFREVINHADIGPFAGIWHLQVLEDFGFIVSRRYKHYKVFYPTTSRRKEIPLNDPRLVLKNKTTKAVFRFISENPGTYQNEIAKELGKAHGTIRYNLKKLIKANIINTEKDNGRRKFFINEEFLNSIRDLT